LKVGSGAILCHLSDVTSDQVNANSENHLYSVPVSARVRTKTSMIGLCIMSVIYHNTIFLHENIVIYVNENISYFLIFGGQHALLLISST